ncbi:MAG: CvpA family protein [Bacteroidales bacterium]|nr:CvpA family protein [Bacteroidales bacterium]
MNFVDIFFVIPLLWFSFKGWKNGAVMEFVQLASIVLGIFVASKFSHFLGNYFNFESEYTGILYFAITFIAVVGMLFLAGYIITTFIKMIMLGWANRLLGVAFALAKTILLMSVLVFYFNKIDREETIFPKEKRDESLLFRPIEKVAPMVMPTLMQLWEKFNKEVIDD